MTNKRCENCKHVYDSSKHPEWKELHCRLNPPTPVAYMRHSYRGDPYVEYESLFPIVMEFEFCSKFEPKEES